VIEAEMVRGVFVDRSEAERNTLGNLFARYLRDVSPTKKGASSESYRLRSLLRDPIAEYKVAALNGKVLAEWRDRRLKEVSGATTNRDLGLISHVINVARKEWGVNVENPVAMIRRPPESKGRNRRLSSDEELRLLKELEPSTRAESGVYEPGGVRNLLVRSIVELAIETAMRRSELLSLRWQDVHLIDRYVRLRDTKNGEARDVPLTRRAVQVLEALPREQEGAVFTTTADAVKKAFERAVKRAGLGDLHFHDLRHEGTSRLAEKLDNVLELSAVTGHKTLSMLKRYYHPRAKDLARKLG
jgi:integrase